MSTTEGGANIVQNGLVFCFDPANTKSFISGSTTANDLKNNILLTFKNKIYSGGGTQDIVTIISPTYNSDNGGSIFFNPSSILSGDAVYLPTGDTSTNLTNFVTLSLWFKKTVSPSWVEVPTGKGFNTPTPSSQAYSFYILNNSIYARVTTNTVNGNSDIGTPYSLNMWNNAVLTYDGTTISLYLNGVLKTSTPKTGPMMNTSNPFNIGCQNNGGYFPASAPSKTSEYFKGYISNVLVYDRSLSQQEISQNYNTLKFRFGLS
jgi:hypothetical protein